MHTVTDKPFRAYIGIDWADSTHDACLQAAGSESSVAVRRPPLAVRSVTTDA